MDVNLSLSDWVAAHPVLDAGVRMMFRHFYISMCLIGTIIYALSFGWLPLVRVATVRQVVRLYVCLIAFLALESAMWPLWKVLVHALPSKYAPVMSSLWGYVWIAAMMAVYRLRRARLVRGCDRAVRRWVGFPEPAAR